jgi:membrane protein YdbS with pleckstrin-like domain
MPEPYKTQLADKGKRDPPDMDQEPKGPPKESPAEEEKKGEIIGEQTISQAEEIMSEPLLIPRNPLALISRSILIIISVDLALALVLLLLATLSTSGSFVFAVAAVLLALKTLALAILVMRAATNWTQHSYYLTERQLLHRRGIVNIEEKVYELDNIRHVRLIQDFIGRQFDFGHLELLIATAGLTETIRLTDLKNPEHFKSVFTNYLG